LIAASGRDLLARRRTLSSNWLCAAQIDELADPLPPVQLQLGWPMGQKNTPQLTLTKELIKFGRRHINQK
jgi:hypothetical protein